MESVSVKNENDANNNNQTSSDEDRERLVLDLKAGLHPLRVRFPPFFSVLHHLYFLTAIFRFSCYAIQALIFLVASACLLTNKFTIELKQPSVVFLCPLTLFSLISFLFLVYCVHGPFPLNQSGMPCTINSERYFDLIK